MTLRSMSTEWTASTSPAVARPRCLSVQSAGSVGVDQLLGGMAPLLIRPAAVCLDHSLLHRRVPQCLTRTALGELHQSLLKFQDQAPEEVGTQVEPFRVLRLGGLPVSAVSGPSAHCLGWIGRTKRSIPVGVVAEALCRAAAPLGPSISPDS